MALPEKRWVQRLDNYAKAFAVLEGAYNLSRARDLTELERMGLIQSFEFTYELAWNLMKDYLTDMGVSGIIGSKGATRAAFKNGIIDDGEVWMDMIERRNETVHAYDEEVAIRVAAHVSDKYVDEMRKLLDTMRKLESEDGDI